MQRILVTVAALAALLLTACATTAQKDIVYTPNYDGIYRLTYSASGGALYYRFYADGFVVSVRTSALPAGDVYNTLTLENANTSRGKWSAGNNGELRIAIDEGTVWYDSRFDIRADGRIALHGLQRSFEFIPATAAGGAFAAIP